MFRVFLEVENLIKIGRLQYFCELIDFEVAAIVFAWFQVVILSGRLF